VQQREETEEDLDDFEVTAKKEIGFGIEVTIMFSSQC